MVVGLPRCLGAGVRQMYGKPQLRRPLNCGFLVVARGGVEPPTFRFSVGRSYQLSYLAWVVLHMRPRRV